MGQYSITKEIRQKTSNGDFSPPIKLGTEQRFVSPLLNSNNNNLEEQAILGNDCISVYWEDDDLQYMTKKFYNGDLSNVSSNGYYILFITYYDKSLYYFSIDSLYLPIYSISKAKYEQDGEDSNLLGDDPDTYNFDDNSDTLEINPISRMLKKEVLCLRTNILDKSNIKINSDILISEKTVSQETDEDGKIYIKESIVNHLND